HARSADGRRKGGPGRNLRLPRPGLRACARGSLPRRRRPRRAHTRLPLAGVFRATGRDGSERYPYATPWGATTRLVGGVVMAHGDDRGLRLPPRVAPQQVVIVPIFREDDRAEVLQAATAV